MVTYSRTAESAQLIGPVIGPKGRVASAAVIERVLAGIHYRMERAYWERTYSHYRRTYDIHPEFVFRDPGARLIGDNPITLGARSYITAGSVLVSYGGSISVGADCRISRQVRIDCSSESRPGPVVIGDGVLLGWSAVVLPGVTIGDGARIGANTVVYRDVPPGGVVKSQMVEG